MNQKNKKIIPIVLIILLILPSILFFKPGQVNADCIWANSPATPCFTTDTPVVTTTGSTSIWTKLGQAFGYIGASEQTADTSLHIKDFAKEVLKETLRAVAKRALAKMSESTVSWINSGFHGSPLFVENPGSFFKDIAKSEIRNLVNKIGYDNVRQPFGKSIALNIINSYKSTFEQNAQYSLSKVTNDPVLLNNFRNDFSVGGWDGFLLTTQFPQNNPIGYQMLVADEQARVLAGTSSSQANKVRDILQQGQGFLSPQKCVTNPYYDTLTNQFTKQPSKDPGVGIFITGRPPELLDCKNAPTSKKKDCEAYNAKVSADYNASQAKGRDDALKANKTYCPNKPDGSSGLENTTPGTVVADQIKGALGSGRVATELSTAMGSSLSAIFDALLNKLMSTGLNALSGKLTGGGNNNNSDELTYNGDTFGTGGNSGAGGGINWNGADQIVVLSTFKKDVQSAIDNANKEIKLIDGSAGNATGASDLISRSGILQVFDNIWPKTQELDMCIPGPNIGWEARINTEVQKTSTDEATINTLNSNADLFKTWVNNKIKIELPGSNSYINAVNSIKNINDQTEELNKRESTLTEILIKLESIKAELSTINTEPDPGSTGEATVVRLKQRFDGMLVDLPSSTTVSDMQNKLADAKDKLTSLSVLLTKCTAERTVKSWSNPGGVDSKLNNSATNTEKQVFCGAYTGENTISCDVIFKTNISDYKKSSLDTAYSAR